VTGKTVKRMVKENTIGLVAISMKVNTKKINLKDMVYMNGKVFYLSRFNGNKYKGLWKVGKQHGKGEYYNGVTGKWTSGTIR
jgi:hypothetical protein